MNSARHERDVTPLYPERSFLRTTVATKDRDASPSLQTRNCSDASLPASLFRGASTKSISTDFGPNMGMVGFPIAIKGLAP
jgi:hypothetical protein